MKLRFNPFRIEIAAFGMQLLDLGSKDLWKPKFISLPTEIENREREKCTLPSKNMVTDIKGLRKTDIS